MRKKVKKSRWEIDSVSGLLRQQDAIRKQYSNTNILDEYDFVICRTYRSYRKGNFDYVPKAKSLKDVCGREDTPARKADREAGFFWWRYNFTFDDKSMKTYKDDFEMSVCGNKCVTHFCRRFKKENAQMLFEF